MQESLHTISPLTSPMGQMKSRRNIAIGLVLIGVVIIAATIGYFLYQKNQQSKNGTLTIEQKEGLIADMKARGVITENSISFKDKQAIIEKQSKAVASATALTPEEKAEIIKQMNSR